MDPKNRNEETCNLQEEEIIALKQLVRLQKERIITIRPCDKGAGIVVLDFNIYMRACYDHLISKQPSINNIDEEQNYYKKRRRCICLRKSKKTHK